MQEDIRVSASIKSKKAFSLRKLSFIIVLFIIFLLPLIFYPSSAVPFQFAKNLLLSVGIVAAFAILTLSIMKSGKFSLPLNVLFGGALAVLVSCALSATFSPSFSASFAGYGFEMGTVSFSLLMFILLYLVSTLFDSKEKVFYSYLLFFLSVLTITLVHTLRFVFGPGFLSFGVLTSTISNTVGNWNDLGLYFGLSVLLSMITLEMIALGRPFKILIFIVLVTSLIFLVIINFLTVWLVLGIFSLMFLIYFAFFGRTSGNDRDFESAEGMSEIKESKVSDDTRRVLVLPLIIAITSFLFLFVFKLPMFMTLMNGDLGNKPAIFLHISNVEARPSWVSTLSVAERIISDHPLFGVGPNHFLNAWLMYKPPAINQSIFWNTDFNYGIGLIPTFMATTGLVGVLGWLLFFVAFFWVGFKNIFLLSADTFTRYLAISSFAAASYLWIMDILYVPGLVIFTLSFFFTGLFAALLLKEKAIKEKTISFSSYSMASFIFVLCLVILLIVSLVFGYSVAKKTIAYAIYQDGSRAFSSEGNLDKAEESFLKALSVSPNSTYYRAVADTYIMQAQNIISQSAPTDETKSKLIQTLSSAQSNIQKAIQANSSDYQNYMTMANYYETLMSVNGDKAYENAKDAYIHAENLNPENPAISLLLGRLEFLKGDKKKAREYVYHALSEKNDYIEAMYLLSQIESADNNIPEAIAAAEAATKASPDNSAVFFQLGVLKYNNKDYSGAALALEKALALVSNYTNAKYFLGLSYQKLGRQSDAIAQFKDLKASNPDNKEVSDILANLVSGKDPFASTVSEKTSKTSKPKSLPIEEKPVSGTVHQ